MVHCGWSWKLVLLCFMALLAANESLLPLKHAIGPFPSIPQPQVAAMPSSCLGHHRLCFVLAQMVGCRILTWDLTCLQFIATSWHISRSSLVVPSCCSTYFFKPNLSRFVEPKAQANHHPMCFCMFLLFQQISRKLEGCKS